MRPERLVLDKARAASIRWSTRLDVSHHHGWSMQVFDPLEPPKLVELIWKGTHMPMLQSTFLLCLRFVLPCLRFVGCWVAKGQKSAEHGSVIIVLWKFDVGWMRDQKKLPQHSHYAATLNLNSLPPIEMVCALSCCANSMAPCYVMANESNGHLDCLCFFKMIAFVSPTNFWVALFFEYEAFVFPTAFALALFCLGFVLLA